MKNKGSGQCAASSGRDETDGKETEVITVSQGSWTGGGQWGMRKRVKLFSTTDALQQHWWKCNLKYIIDRKVKLADKGDKFVLGSEIWQ